MVEKEELKTPPAFEDEANYYFRDGRNYKKVKKWDREGLKPYLTVALFVMFFLPAVLGCNSNAIVESKDQVCQPNPNGQITCTIKTNIDLKLKFLGDRSCISFIRNDGAPSNMQVMIQYIGVIATYPLSDQYYTSDWTGQSISAHRCWDTLNGLSQPNKCSGSPAGAAPQCDLIQSTGVMNNAMGELPNGPIMFLPGRTGCRRSCPAGCASCFYPHSGCVFNRYAIQPGKEVFILKKATTPIFTPKILVRITDASGIREIISSTNEAIPVPGFVVSLNGIFSQTITDMSNDYIMVHNNTATTLEPTRWVPASARNQPVVLTIGDIQAASQAALLSPTETSFAYAPNLFTRVEHDTSEGFEWAQSGYSRRLVYQTFPAISGGDIWYYKQNTIESNLTNPAGIDLSIKMDGSFALSQTVSLVCPKMSLVSASGCYSCAKGSIIAIKIKSTCGDGVVSIESSDPQVVVFSQHISIGSTDDDVTIYIDTPKKLNSFYLTATGTGSSDKVLVEFAAFPDLNINGTQTYYTGTYSSGPDSGFNLGIFGDWLDSVFTFKTSNPWDYIGAAALIIAIFLASAALFMALLGSTVLIVVMTWRWVLGIPGFLLKFLTRPRVSKND